MRKETLGEVDRSYTLLNQTQRWAAQRTEGRLARETRSRNGSLSAGRVAAGPPAVTAGTAIRENDKIRLDAHAVLRSGRGHCQQDIDQSRPSAASAAA